MIECFSHLMVNATLEALAPRVDERVVMVEAAVLKAVVEVRRVLLCP